MVMTEKEAMETKRCWQSGGGPFNGPCAGSQCMAWRWYVPTEDETELTEHHALAGVQVVQTGYCGLVGRRHESQT